MSRQLADYHYELPPELVAAHPLESRDASRMMLVDRASGTIRHAAFRDFPSLLQPRDLVVLNNSKVIKARLLREDPKVELFLLEPTPEPNTWKCLAKPGRRTRAGAVIAIAGTTAEVREVLPDGERIVFFHDAPDLEKFGSIPLPPYLKRDPDASDAERYQTVYAKPEGSVAAPTAGLHFTPEILAKIPHAFVTLHVGAGTFLPVKVDDITRHEMHEERFEISSDAARAVNEAGRVVAVGTTVMRVLESRPPGPLQPGAGRTNIFIYPPFTFQKVGALLTNFHLPGSTLLMLVSAFAGMDLAREAYAQAVRERYRFFSYGDCMLIT